MADKNYAKLNTPLVLTIGIVTTIVVFGLVVPGVRALFSVRVEAFEQRNRVWVESRALEQYEAQEEYDLTNFWVDEETGTNHVPLAAAQEAIVKGAATRGR